MGILVIICIVISSILHLVIAYINNKRICEVEKQIKRIMRVIRHPITELGKN